METSRAVERSGALETSAEGECGCPEAADGRRWRSVSAALDGVLGIVFRTPVGTLRVTRPTSLPLCPILVQAKLCY